jgi:hypothetical protein
VRVIKKVKPQGKQSYALYECPYCQNKVVRRLSHGANQKSCGCMSPEFVRQRQIKHGASKTRLYNIWKGMRARCFNVNSPAYPRYGGRGILICSAWNSYPPFQVWARGNGYSENLTIDRINNDGNYCPENCRWIPRSENNKNRIHKKKLNETQIAEIHTRRNRGESYEAIARIYGVAPMTIWKEAGGA